jgi:hypothetical protein
MIGFQKINQKTKIDIFWPRLQNLDLTVRIVCVQSEFQVRFLGFRHTFVLMSLQGGRLARLASLASLGVRFHCGDLLCVRSPSWSDLWIRFIL